MAIELRDVTASSGGYEILNSASVSFPEGLCSVVMGTAGSGKSTLLKVAAGLVVPDAGSVLFRGNDMARFARKEELAFRATTGFVFQDSALWADTNILGNVAMPLRVHHPDMMEKSVAEAVHDPTSNLDEDASEKVFELLDELRKKRRTIIVVANNTDLAFRFADRLGIIKGGMMAAFGTYEATVGSAEAALVGSLARLRARGNRTRASDDDAGTENSQRGDV